MWPVTERLPFDLVGPSTDRSTGRARRYLPRAPRNRRNPAPGAFAPGGHGRIVFAVSAIGATYATGLVSGLPGCDTVPA